jgi:ABC-type cobalt transport system, permease component CbiQ and related transporters
MQVVIGQYIPANSWVHRLDPRTKLVGLILLIVSTFLIQELITMLSLLFVVLVLFASSKIPLKRFFRGIAPLLFLLTFTVIFQLLLNRQGELLYQRTGYLGWQQALLTLIVIVVYQLLKRVTRYRFAMFVLSLVVIFYSIQLEFAGSWLTFDIAVYQGGVVFALFLVTRIVILITLSSLLTLTTKPTDLNNGLEEVMKPLRRFKVPTNEIAMMIAIALRFIPTLLDEANKIMKAQSSRGVDFNEGTLRQKVTQIISLLIPMFIISFKRADDLANAMEARGYAPGRIRSKYVTFHMQVPDYVLLAVTIGWIPVVVLLGL